MDAWIEVINKVGVPIAGLIFCGYIIVYLVKRNMDESAGREQKLIDANSKNSEALSKIADTIHETNEVNRELSEKNKVLTEIINSKLDGIDKDVNKVIDILHKEV